MNIGIDTEPTIIIAIIQNDNLIVLLTRWFQKNRQSTVRYSVTSIKCGLLDHRHAVVLLHIRKLCLKGPVIDTFG